MAKPRTFVKTIDGRETTQLAHTPADAVRLAFDGWREQEPPRRSAAKKAATTPSK